MINILQQFAEHLAGAGLVAEHLRADGLLHRCGTTEKPHGTDGAYKACLDAPASLWWNNWRTGDTGTWCAASTKDMTPAERNALRARIAEATAAAEKKKAERRAQAASTAARLWKRAATVTGMEHPGMPCSSPSTPGTSWPWPKRPVPSIRNGKLSSVRTMM